MTESLFILRVPPDTYGPREIGGGDLPPFWRDPQWCARYAGRDEPFDGVHIVAEDCIFYGRNDRPAITTYTPAGVVRITGAEMVGAVDGMCALLGADCYGSWRQRPPYHRVELDRCDIRGVEAEPGQRTKFGVMSYGTDVAITESRVRGFFNQHDVYAHGVSRDGAMIRLSSLEAECAEAIKLTGRPAASLYQDAKPEDFGPLGRYRHAREDAAWPPASMATALIEGCRITGYASNGSSHFPGGGAGIVAQASGLRIVVNHTAIYPGPQSGRGQMCVGIEGPSWYEGFDVSAGRRCDHDSRRGPLNGAVQMRHCILVHQREASRPAIQVTGAASLDVAATRLWGGSMRPLDTSGTPADPAIDLLPDEDDFDRAVAAGIPENLLTKL